MKPKILQMGADNFGAGGRSVIAYNMTRPLTNDFQVDFLAIGKLKNPSFHRIIEENGGHVQHVKEVSSKIKRLRSIYSILKKEKYDIVHINADDAIEGLFNIILSKLSGAKIVLHAHTTSSSRGKGFIGRLKMLSAKKIVNFLVDYKLACSLEAADYLYGDTDLSDVAIIKNGIVINDFLYNEELRQNVRENLNIPMEAIVLGTVGRLSYEKNPEFMVSLIQTLFSKAPNFYFIWIGDGEERAEVYGCAADRQQATIVFDVAADMVRMCPALNKRVKILASQKRIIYTPTNSFYQVLSAEAQSKPGFNIHGVVFDELHTQPNRKLFDVMTKGSGDARMQPLYFLITTAGTDTNSICYETHQKAKDILEGRKIDTTFYPVIYGADESDDWTDPRVWRKANPSLDITVGIDKVEAACNSAKQNPSEENSFRQLRLNQWVKQAVRWMPMEKWDACAFPVDEDELEGRVCYGGLDLSSTTDITAFVLVFPPLDEDDKYVVLPYFWVPEDTLDLRVRRDHVPYDLWERKGYLQTTEGNVVHYGYIEKFIEKLGERFNIREIAFDRWGAVQMVQNLEGMGFTVVPFGQGFKDMSPPTKELMKLVLEKRIAHGGHPVLRWNMDNIFIRTDPAGNIKADKEKSTEKIDGAVATIMALDRAIRCGNDAGESVYDTRGLLVF